MSTPTAVADALVPSTHPFAAHLRRHADLTARTPRRNWMPDDGILPALYVSHGAPPTFEDAVWMRQMYDWAATMPTPRAILIVSAHWESDSIGIASTVPTELVYDFGGFHPMYYGMRYDTPDSGPLADLLISLLPDTAHVHEHRGRGLDHGAWLPLKVMYPDADVPVLQLSLPTSDPGSLVALGARLRSLREHGVLVVGSGFMTHGLPFIDWHRPELIPDWSADFDAWTADCLARGDVEELTRFRTRAPGVDYAHPTVEHFTPLFVTLGAATDATIPVTTAIDGFVFGGLSKRSFQVA